MIIEGNGGISRNAARSGWFVDAPDGNPDTNSINLNPKIKS